MIELGQARPCLHRRGSYVGCEVWICKTTEPEEYQGGDPALFTSKMMTQPLTEALETAIGLVNFVKVSALNT